MMPLIGYADRLSVRPGETIAFKVSSAADEPYEAALVRIVHADPNPAGPGMRDIPLDDVFSGRFASRPQPVLLGSHARIDQAPRIPTDNGVTLIATIWPTAPQGGAQELLRAPGFSLAIGEDGSATASLDLGSGDRCAVSAGMSLHERRWYRVWASFDPACRVLSAGQAPLDALHHGTSAATASCDCPDRPAADGQATITIAARDGAPPRRHFNGKIELPQVFARTLAPEEIEAAAKGEVAPDLWARWDFSREMSSTRIVDTGPHGLHGRLINMPARAMTGSNWSGREMCWRHAPSEYGAIHFHDDDIGDCGWETDFTFTVPQDCRSGAYAVRLTCGEHEDAVPFFVCPPKGKRRAELCVLIPTFTYVIYGNHARTDFGEHWRARAKAWRSYPWNPADHPDYGLSTYNFHSDGSGICHASRLRPLLTLRPGFVSIAEQRGSGLRHFQADTHLLDWLEAKGHTFDILTDEELHNEGHAAIAGYRCVLTSTHPEYHTAETLDALEAYRDGGGRLAYLGGNGFYWRIAVHPETPGVLEIRRGEGGIRAWAAEPGEYHNAFDGAYGGLWRRNGRPPQRLAGVGFSAQGLFEGSYYRRRPAAADPRVAWIFEGVEDEILGDFGLSGGGAAGYELDRADRRLGTPDHTVILAGSEGHGEHFVLVPEELLTHVTTWSGEPPDELIRADMVFFEAPNGGAVFSTGSITFCGSLSHNGYDNNISRILENVVNGFLDPDADFSPATADAN
jgi:N,N-dimethylformamidase